MQMVSAFMGGDRELTDFMPSVQKKEKEKEIIKLKGKDLENFIFASF